MKGTKKIWISPAFTSSIELTIADGPRATIPAKMISEMPLPTPRSVICSPSHIRNAVPEVRVIIVISLNWTPGSRTIISPPGPVMPSRPTAMKEP